MKRAIIALLLILFVPVLALAADQNATATILSIETTNPYTAFTDASTGMIDITNDHVPYSAYFDTTTTQISAELSTTPKVTEFSYTYDPDSNQLTVTFTLTDTNNTPIYVNVYAVTENNVIPLASGIQLSSGQQYTHTYTLGEQPQGVYISFIAAAPGQYPPTIHMFAPEFEIGTTIIPFTTDYAGNLVIAVTNGYSISPITSTPNMALYAVASRAGPVGIYAQAKLD